MCVFVQPAAAATAAVVEAASQHGPAAAVGMAPTSAERSMSSRLEDIVGVAGARAAATWSGRA